MTYGILQHDKQSLLSLDMKTKVVVTVTETVTVTDTDTFGSQLLSKTFDLFIYFGFRRFSGHTN